jgi:ABC-type nitrate/sulfonate/bicarbonate transport system substrate-binding protein
LRRVALSAVALVASATLIAGCASTTTAADGSGLSSAFNPEPLAEKTVVKVGYPAGLELHTVTLLAKEMGEFEKENLDVQLEVLPSTDSLPLLAGGSLDATLGGITVAVLNAVSGGAVIKDVYPGPSQADADGLWVRTEIADQGPAALKGKSMATSAGAGVVGIIAIQNYLAEGGLTLDDVDMQTISLADLPAAFESGALDAVWLSSPAHLPFAQAGTARKVAGLADDEIVTAVFFGPNLLEAHPEVGQAFIRALKRTELTYLQGDYKADPEIRASVAAALGLTEDELMISESLTFGHTLESSFYEEAQRAWIAIGDIVSFTEPLAPEQYLDSSFIDRIVLP